jgi:CheY-like chemotaxis protein
MPKVLLVEDDEDLQRVFSYALKMEGFEVSTARSGAEALVRVEDTQFDIILLDMLMAGMSGLDFLRAYDVRTKSPATKVIALTNLDNPAIAQKALSLGVIEYLNKSKYEPNQLVTHLKSLLAQP